MWISYIFQMVCTVFSTWIMGRPVLPCVTIEVVVSAVPVTSTVKHRSITLNSSKHARCRLIITRGSHVFHDLAAYIPVLPINQTSSSRMTNQPVVDVAFDQDLSAKLFPLREVYGIVVCFIHWRSRRDGDIYFLLCWPIWSWCDSVWFRCKMNIICECITPH